MGKVKRVSGARGLIVKKAKHGLGVFSTRAFMRGERVVTLTGHLITCGVEDVLDERTRDNAIRFDEDVYLSPDGGVGDYFNHSCNPNVYIIKKDNALHIIARRNIRAEQELCFDYATITASDDIWEMQCACGSAMCRKKVKQFIKLPKAVQKQYLREGMVPEYVYKA